MATNGINVEQSNAALAKSRIYSWKKFGLRSSPFDNSFKCNYGSRIEHFQATLNKLNSFCNSHENTAIITGASGVGKTLMCNDFLKEHNDQFCKIAIPADFSSADILNAVSSSLSLNLMVVGSNQNAYILQIVHAILTQEEKFILVCDDSHKLTDEALNTIIELLSNTKLATYIKVILFGNSSIFERIVKYAVCKDSGITLMHCIMNALPEDQIKLYLHNCLVKSGWPGALPEIPAAVINEIFQESGGIPRRINIAAEKILLRCLSAQPQSNNTKHEKDNITTKAHVRGTHKQHSYLKSITATWQNPTTAIAVNLGFVIMLCGSYIWYQDQGITKISKVTEPAFNAYNTKLAKKDSKDLLARVNQSLAESKVNDSFDAHLAVNTYSKTPTIINDAKSKVSIPQLNENITPYIEHLSGYTIQLSASSNLKALIEFKNQQHLEQEMYIYKSDRDDSPWYTLVYGSFLTKKAAKEAIDELQQTTSLKGLWAKSFLDIHLSSHSYIHAL